MPSYQNVTPPLSLFSGDVGFSFNNEAFPGGAQAGSQFALPSFTGLTDGGTAVRRQTIFGTAPTAGEYRPAKERHGRRRFVNLARTRYGPNNS